MFKRVILVLIGVLTFAGSEVFAQTKITLETTSFPKNFEGHDAAILVKNLNALLQTAKGKNAVTIQKSVKGKAVYENLTTDDFFAFPLSAAEYVYGRNVNTGLRYRAAIFPLKNLNDFPSPKLKYAGGIGMGSGDPGFSSIEELAPVFSSAQPLETIWTTSYLPIKSVYSAEALEKKYIGKKANCRPSTYSSDIQVCDGRDFSVPSPQVHYGISFAKTQPFALVNAEEETLSLKTYQFNTSIVPGIAAWLENGDQYGGNTEAIFIVRLTAPYLTSKSVEILDPIEQKPHRAVRNILPVELLGIWIYDRQTGKIYSKNGEKAIVPDSAAGKENQSSALKNKELPAGKIVLQDAPLNITSKPRHYYTDEARKKNVQGTVQLKVTFLASGQIGAISVVEGLPDGLTEEAVKAARNIKFTPLVENGVPKTIAKIVTYTFTIY